jgi:hypothetical protein
MNAVEIEEAVSNLASKPFDREEFPFTFLEAYGNKETTIKRLRKGNSNKSNVPGGILQRSNIHLAVCAEGQVSDTLQQLSDAPETAKQKAKFILATDGEEIQAEDLTSGDTLACDYANLDEHFTFFFELAGISTVKEIRESAFDIKATSRLNKLYLELLGHNPDWATAERRTEMNHFMARLIFCFFAEDTSIFNGDNLFTGTIEKISDPDGGNVHEIIAECFRSMDTHFTKKNEADIRVWARSFPYVNGELFSGSRDCPRFTRIARTYLLHVGKLNWKQINPDIFGSMIQAVADEKERSSLGMHYTSVPNILKVLNPLFLDELREQLTAAGDNNRKLANLRRRIAHMRVFDPACGSGNFLVIAYKQLREIEYEVNQRREEKDRKSEIPLTNFRGIELKSFSAEIARLALIIAEYQCDVLYLGQQLALAEFLPLNSQNWITCGNALRLNWLTVCPQRGAEVEVVGDGLFSGAEDQAKVDFENEGEETYICGNPPFQSYSDRNKFQNAEMETVFKDWGKIKRLDYIACWFKKAVDYIKISEASAALVSTNSICQGEQVSLLWPRLLKAGVEIFFAQQSFHWKNNAKANAGVTCVIVGLALKGQRRKSIYTANTSRSVSNISPYLIEGANLVVSQHKESICNLPNMALGSSAIDGGNLILERSDLDIFFRDSQKAKAFIKPYVSGTDIIKGIYRFCIWIEDSKITEAMAIPAISDKIIACKIYRKGAGRDARKAANVPHRFFYRKYQDKFAIAVPATSSGRREYLPVAVLPRGVVPSHGLQVSYDDPFFVFSVVSSKMHAVWMATTSARLRNDFRYSVNLTYFTFPLPKLTEKNKRDMIQCAGNILLARERHFPATIADLYDPKKMPEDLKRAHDRNDEVLERIYIGRRFKNDTERLEKLFELYTEMTAKGG